MNYWKCMIRFSPNSHVEHISANNVGNWERYEHLKKEENKWRFWIPHLESCISLCNGYRYSSERLQWIRIHQKDSIERYPFVHHKYCFKWTVFGRRVLVGNGCPWVSTRMHEMVWPKKEGHWERRKSICKNLNKGNCAYILATHIQTDEYIRYAGPCHNILKLRRVKHEVHDFDMVLEEADKDDKENPRGIIYSRDSRHNNLIKHDSWM